MLVRDDSNAGLVDHEEEEEEYEKVRNDNSVWLLKEPEHTLEAKDVSSRDVTPPRLLEYLSV